MVAMVVKSDVSSGQKSDQCDLILGELFMSPRMSVAVFVNETLDVGKPRPACVALAGVRKTVSRKAARSVG
jgi:hypothetical protein